MQTIHTRYLPPTNTKPARFVARPSHGQLKVIYSQHVLEGLGAQGNDACHVMAAQKLLKRLMWNGRWIGGDSSDRRGMTFICMDDKHPLVIENLGD